MDYGTGAVMCVPAHDERDLAFAKQYSLPVIQSIDESGEHPRLINSDEMNGLTPEEARVAITKKLEKDGLAEYVTTYR
jgi:leucyl-tRNA synthetase